LQWTSVGEFLAMGGYALYVWPTFGLAAAVLAGLWLDSRARLAAAQRDLAVAERLRAAERP
jgi:heme exporter protein D